MLSYRQTGVFGHGNVVLMLWFFSRDEESLRVETRWETSTRTYLAIIDSPDGKRQIERFHDLGNFREYLLDLERRLEGERWQRADGPTFLPDGWPDESAPS